MPLKIDLRNDERIYVGEATIVNITPTGVTSLLVLGDAPVLKEADFMSDEQADSPCKHVFLLVQSMYLTRAPDKYADRYFNLVRQIQETMPGAASYITKINGMIKEGAFYKALKEIKKLIEYEQGSLQNLHHGGR